MVYTCEFISAHGARGRKDIEVTFISVGKDSFTSILGLAPSNQGLPMNWEHPRAVKLDLPSNERVVGVNHTMRFSSLLFKFT